MRSSFVIIRKAKRLLFTCEFKKARPMPWICRHALDRKWACNTPARCRKRASRNQTPVAELLIHDPRSQGPEPRAGNPRSVDVREHHLERSTAAKDRKLSGASLAQGPGELKPRSVGATLHLTECGPMADDPWRWVRVIIRPKRASRCWTPVDGLMLQ